METKGNKIKLPRSEIGLVEILNPKTRQIEYLISQNERTGRFSIFKITDSNIEKLGTSNTPLELERKYVKRKENK